MSYESQAPAVFQYGNAPYLSWNPPSSTPIVNQPQVYRNPTFGESQINNVFLPINRHTPPQPSLRGMPTEQEVRFKE